MRRVLSRNGGGCLFLEGGWRPQQLFFPGTLPTTTLGSQCVKCCVEHYPDRLRATNESTGFPLWLGSALRSKRGHSIHSVPWPQTAVGHRPLEAQVCSPGKVTPCFYMAGGSSMVSPLSMRDPHNTCGWAPNP